MWNITNSTLGKSDLRHTRLSIEGTCVVTECDLTGSHITGNLGQTTLFGCVLHGTDFREATLAGVDLTGSYYTGTTRWPDGFDPVAAGAIQPSDKIRHLLGIPSAD